MQVDTKDTKSFKYIGIHINQNNSSRLIKKVMTKQSIQSLLIKIRYQSLHDR